MSDEQPKRCTTSGKPIDEQTTQIDPDTGMQKDYIVLCAEERAKGFVRPVRTSYVHVGIRPKHPVRDLTDEERRDYASEGYVKFEEYPPNPASSTVGRFWTDAQLKSGCGGLTTMGRSLAETYAREPGFYSGTFCAHCRKHFNVGAEGEFVWDGTNERVGT